jgi:hypothetical protein
MKFAALRFLALASIESRAAPFRTVRAWHPRSRSARNSWKSTTVFRRSKLVALGRELFQPLVNFEKSRLPPHPRWGRRCEVSPAAVYTTCIRLFCVFCLERRSLRRCRNRRTSVPGAPIARYWSDNTVGRG